MNGEKQDMPVSGMPDRETFVRDYGTYVMEQSRIIGALRALRQRLRVT